MWISKIKRIQTLAKAKELEYRINNIETEIKAEKLEKEKTRLLTELDLYIQIESNDYLVCKFTEENICFNGTKIHLVPHQKTKLDRLEYIVTYLIDNYKVLSLLEKRNTNKNKKKK